MRRELLIGLAGIALVVILFYSLFTSVWTTPLEETRHFKATNRLLDSLAMRSPQLEGDTLKVGWSKVNLTPPFPTSLAGYGLGEHETVSDSLWMRAFVFDDGQKRFAILIPDLLIFPPLVRDQLEKDMPQLGVDGIHYTATHTHHSLGNWHPGLVGRAFAGSYEQRAVAWIAEKSREALFKAQALTRKVTIGYAAIQAEDLVSNRLVHEMGTIDPWLRLIYFRQDSGQTAVITSFAAHPTTISRDLHTVHRDYPGVLTDQLEKSPAIDFAAFVAGAMGSQGPARSSEELDLTSHMGLSAAQQVEIMANVVQPQYQTTLIHHQFELPLGSPQYRISDTYRLRPWLFNLIFGEASATINSLQVGDILLVGTPCDFSGELVRPLDSLARSRKINLMIGSFNGDYIGYITDDDHYMLDSYETRVMNWFGPHNGRYFSHVISRMIRLSDGQ